MRNRHGSHLDAAEPTRARFAPPGPHDADATGVPTATPVPTVEGFRKRRVYLAGPMTGYPLYNFPAFDRARDEWEREGWEVASPADICRDVWRERFGGCEFNPAIDRCDYGGSLIGENWARNFSLLCTCDAIAMLPGWRQSKGALRELAVAQALGLIASDAVTYALLGAQVKLTVEDLDPPAPVNEKPAPLPETVLEEAQRIVYGDREAAYSHPHGDFTRIARMWSGYLDGATITPADVAEMLVLLKVARARVDIVHGRPVKRDTLVDTAGYAECASRVAEREAELRSGRDFATEMQEFSDSQLAPSNRVTITAENPADLARAIDFLTRNAEERAACAHPHLTGVAK